MSMKSFCPLNRVPPPAPPNFEVSLLICTVLPHFGPFGGGGKTKFCGQDFYGHPDFSEKGPLRGL